MSYAFIYDTADTNKNIACGFVIKTTSKQHAYSINYKTTTKFYTVHQSLLKTLSQIISNVDQKLWLRMQTPVIFSSIAAY